MLPHSVSIHCHERTTDDSCSCTDGRDVGGDGRPSPWNENASGNAMHTKSDDVAVAGIRTLDAWPLCASAMVPLLVHKRQTKEMHVEQPTCWHPKDFAHLWDLVYDRPIQSLETWGTCYCCGFHRSCHG